MLLFLISYKKLDFTYKQTCFQHYKFRFILDIPADVITAIKLVILSKISIISLQFVPFFYFALKYMKSSPELTPAI